MHVIFGFGVGMLRSVSIETRPTKENTSIPPVSTGLLDCCKEPPLSLALFVPWLMEGGKQTLFLTHMSSFAQVMLHKSSQSRNNGDRLG